MFPRIIPEPLSGCGVIYVEDYLRIAKDGPVNYPRVLGRIRGGFCQGCFEDGWGLFRRLS